MEEEDHTGLFEPGSGLLSFLPSAGPEALAPSLPPARLGGGAADRADAAGPRAPIPTLSPERVKPTRQEAVEGVLRHLPRRRIRAGTRGTQTGIRAELERRLLSHLSRSLPPGEALASVLSRAATLEDRSGQGGVSRALRESALQAAPRHPMVLRDLRRQALLAGDHKAAGQVVARELDAAQSPTASRALRALMRELSSEAAPAEAPVDAGLPELIQAAAARGERGDQYACGLGLLQASKRAQGALRTGLATAAAQALLASGDARSAQEACEMALAAGPEHIGIALLAARVAFQERDYPATTRALTRLLRSSPNRTQSRAIRRLAAQIAMDHGHAPEEGKAILGSPESPSEARLLLRSLSEQGGLEAEVQRALRHWQKHTDEHRAAVPLCELGRRALRAGEEDEAQKLFEQAESLMPQAPEELGFSRDARGRFIRATLARDTPEGDLAMAAARATLQGGDSNEAMLLAELSTHLDDAASTALGHDVEMANRRTLRAAVLQWAQRLRGDQALGPMLALHSFAEPSKRKLRLDSLTTQHGTSLALWAALLTDLGSDGLNGIPALDPASAHSPLQVALARLRAPDPASLEESVPPAVKQLQTQVQAQPDSAATSDLRVLGLLAGNGDLVEQVEGLLAIRSRARVERATHLLSAGTAVARTEPRKARLYLQRCAELMPADPVFKLLQQRMEYATTEAREPPPAVAPALDPAQAQDSGLASAARDEFEGRLDAANYHYGELEQVPELAALALSGKVRCALRAGDHDSALALLEARLGSARGAESEAAAFSAVLDAQPFASHAPDLDASATRARRHSSHVPTLRALERSASTHGRPELLQEAAERLSVALSHRSDRTAYFKLWARMIDGTVESDVMEQALHARFHELSLGHPSLCLFAERVARRVGDREMLLRSLRAQVELAESDNERASLALAIKRALLDPDGARSSSQTDLQAAIHESIALLRPHVVAAPGHPTVAEELALLYLLAGRRREAADTLVQAATAANAAKRRASFLFHAARLYEFLGDTDRAEELLTRVVESDPNHDDALQQLESLLRTHRRLPALAALYAQKIARETDPQARLLLGLERHGFYLALGEVAVAEHLLEELFEDHDDPDGVLVATASSLRSQGRHRAAVSALIALAGRARAPDLLRHAYFSLGEIYQDELSDMRRAEVAFSRCLRVDRGDLDALDRLAQIFATTQRPSKELRILRRLLELSPSEADQERYQLRVQRLEATLD